MPHLNSPATPNPPNPVLSMTEAERLAFRLSVHADSMGFDGAEGVMDDAADHP